MDDYLGEIWRKPDPPGISNPRWIEMIHEHPNLVPISPEPRVGINPFTNEPIVCTARPGDTLVIVDGREVGSMLWAMDGSNSISVFGEVEAVVPLAQDIAKSLGGCFKIFDGEDLIDSGEWPGRTSPQRPGRTHPMWDGELDG